MFVQVIEGRVRDRDAARAQFDRWVAEVAEGATGWLGSTIGVADDGTLVALARFESEDAARANSDRPEQSAWWDETEASFEGEVTFRDCPDVDTFGGGGSDDAGFVQVMYGRADRAKVNAAVREAEDFLLRARPDVIGGILGWPGAGTFVEAVYFASEADARSGEQSEPSPEGAEAMARVWALMQVDRYVDLRDPWLFRPA